MWTFLTDLFRRKKKPLWRVVVHDRELGSGLTVLWLDVVPAHSEQEALAHVLNPSNVGWSALQRALREGRWLRATVIPLTTEDARGT
jgi:hypothetical protein